MIGKIKKLPKFLKEVREELKKVNWSTRSELVGAAVIVVVVSAFLTGYIALIDFSLTKAVHFLLR